MVAYKRVDCNKNFLLFPYSGVPEVFPRIFVIGALGRCGRGAVQMAHKIGIPK